MVLDTEYYSEEPVRVGGSGDDGADDHGDDASGDGSAGSGSRHMPPAPPHEALAPGGKPLSARRYDDMVRQRRDSLEASLIRHLTQARGSVTLAIASQPPPTCRVYCMT